MPLSLMTIRSELRGRLDESDNLFDKVLQLGPTNRRLKKHSFTLTEVESIIELCFLRNHLAMEEFLERAFQSYMLGEAAPSGLTHLRFVSPVDEVHALKILSGNRSYVTWENRTEIVRKAELFLRNGEPFKSAFRTFPHDVYDNLQIIRNRIAHRSGVSLEKFEVFVRNSLGTFPTGTTPGKYLLNLAPAEPPKRKPHEYFYKYYCRKIWELAMLIAP